MKRNIVFVAVVALLGIVGVHSPAQAGTGSPNECSGPGDYGEWRIPLLTSPITLGIVVFNGEGAHPRYRLCYSTSEPGDSGPDTTGGNIEYGSNVYWPNERGDYSWIECSPQSNPSGVAASCYIGQDDHGGTTACVGSCAYVAADPQVHYGEDCCSTYPAVSEQTLAFSFPITACYGSCVSHSESVGPTGVLSGQLEPTDPWREIAGPPAGTSVGAGYRLTYLTYCVDGSCTPLTPETYIGAGAAVSTGPSGVITCFSPVCVPGGGSVQVGSTLAAVQIGSTTIPVSSPVGAVDECVYFWEVVYETLFNLETPCR